MQITNNSHDYNNNDRVKCFVETSFGWNPLSFFFTLLLYVILALPTLKHPLSSGVGGWLAFNALD